MAYPFTGIVAMAGCAIACLLMYARLIWLDNCED